ncbi:MAG: 50S ribosomal protein L23 [Candidatus Helarchaeales archaeon]
MSSPHDIILKPLMTESAFNMIDKENKLVFIVKRSANKKVIKWAVEKLFNVKVEKVNTLIQKDGKKKAFVKLTPEYIAGDIATNLGIF